MMVVFGLKQELLLFFVLIWRSISFYGKVVLVVDVCNCIFVKNCCDRDQNGLVWIKIFFVDSDLLYFKFVYFKLDGGMQYK